MSKPQVYILNEKKEWDTGLVQALHDHGFVCHMWSLHDIFISLSKHTPPPAPSSIFINRFSPSFYWRDKGRRNTLGSVRGLVRWLESQGHRVINGTQAVELEASKVAQYLACRQAGLRAPYTTMVVGAVDTWRDALQEWKKRPLHSSSAPIVIKPNCGGSGQNVRIFENLPALEQELRESPEWFSQISIDGVALMQDMIQASFIYRLEFIGGDLFYVVKIRTESSSLNRCPCEQNLSTEEDGAAATCARAPKFEIVHTFPQNESEWMLVQTLKRMLRLNNVCIAGIEIMQDAHQRWWVIDCNCVNTNYNVVAEKNADLAVGGNARIAQWLGGALLTGEAEQAEEKEEDPGGSGGARAPPPPAPPAAAAPGPR